MQRWVMLWALVAAQAALADEVGSEPGLLLTDWNLVEIDGTAATAQTTLRLEDGRVVGQGPCNRYFGDLTGDLPGFHVENLGSTKMACADLGLEAAYFQTLTAVDHAEMQDGKLTLTGGGHSLRFEKPLE